MSTADRDGKVAQLLADMHACLAMKINESVRDAENDELAEAWDNGYLYGHDADLGRAGLLHNPYRDLPPTGSVTVRTERDHRWFEYGRWFDGFGPSMDPHRCDEDGVICEWRERTVTTTTITTPWAAPVTSQGDSDA